jgi:hypothetical protein
MGYDEFLRLAGMIHKSTLIPKQMARAGFQFDGPPTVVIDSVIYWADVDNLRLEALGDVGGIAGNALSRDDGRGDWRAEYLRLLRASRAMQVPERAPPAPFDVRVQRLARGVRSVVRGR